MDMGLGLGQGKDSHVAFTSAPRARNANCDPRGGADFDLGQHVPTAVRTKSQLSSALWIGARGATQTLVQAACSGFSDGLRR